MRSRRINTANIALATTFALIMLLAFDLDRAGEGLIYVNQQPMIGLYQRMSRHQYGTSCYSGMTHPVHGIA